MHHARHAAGRGEQAHAGGKRGDIAAREPLGARGALFVEIRLAHRAVDALEFFGGKVARPIRPARLAAFAHAHHEPDGAARPKGHEDRATDADGIRLGRPRRTRKAARAVGVEIGIQKQFPEQPRFGDCIGVGRVEGLRGDVQDDGC